MAVWMLSSVCLFSSTSEFNMQRSRTLGTSSATKMSRRAKRESTAKRPLSTCTNVSRDSFLLSHSIPSPILPLDIEEVFYSALKESPNTAVTEYNTPMESTTAWYLQQNIDFQQSEPCDYHTFDEKEYKMGRYNTPTPSLVSSSSSVETTTASRDGKMSFECISSTETLLERSAELLHYRLCSKSSVDVQLIKGNYLHVSQPAYARVSCDIAIPTEHRTSMHRSPSYFPSRRAPLAPIAVTPTVETSFMEWDEPLSRFSKVKQSFADLRSQHWARTGTSSSAYTTDDVWEKNVPDIHRISMSDDRPDPSYKSEQSLVRQTWPRTRLSKKRGLVARDAVAEQSFATSPAYSNTKHVSALTADQTSPWSAKNDGQDRAAILPRVETWWMKLTRKT